MFVSRSCAALAGLSGHITAAMLQGRMSGDNSDIAIAFLFRLQNAIRKFSGIKLRTGGGCSAEQDTAHAASTSISQ
jgi:hypothetical protein